MAIETDPGKGAPDIKLPDPVEFSRSMAKIAQRSQRLVTEFLTRQQTDRHVGMSDPLNVGSAFLEMTAKLIANPTKLMEAQVNLWRDYMTLWQNTTRRWLGAEAEPVAEPHAEDRRFKDPSWDENAALRLHQAVLSPVRALDPERPCARSTGSTTRPRKKVDFYTRQFVDAMAPSNFVLTNPEVLARHRSRPAARTWSRGSEQPAGGPRARQGQAAHQDDRHGRVQARREHRRDAGQGRLSERPDAAHPVRARRPRRY